MRDHLRLFTAMNDVIRVLLTGGDERDALRRSFEHAAAGFGAEKALLLAMEGQDPLRLHNLYVKGLTDEQVRACERGESATGVSSSVIRTAIRAREIKLIENPLFQQDTDQTPALAGQNFSVLCAPILDPVRDTVLAVLYFQNSGADLEQAYKSSDSVWLQGYASAVGHAFGFAFERYRRERELSEMLRGQQRPEDAPDIIGESPSTQALREHLHEIVIPAADAPDPDPVLILGEKGTGKDLVARYVHAYSSRHERPLVVINCAEITDELASARFFGHKKGAFTGAIADEPGLFRAAHGGTLFLDEIGDLSRRAQAMLLRVLENRTVVPIGETREVRVDVQVILATNRDLDSAVANGVLRPELVDRFKAHAMRLLPLRERPWDVPPLVRHFIAFHEHRMRKKTLGLTAAALRALLAYAWPGNVREVARVSSLLVSHARPGMHIEVDLLHRAYPDLATQTPHLKAGAQRTDEGPLREAVRAFEREVVLARLERHNWNARAARESLGLPKTTFHRYMTALGLTPPSSDEL